MVATTPQQRTRSPGRVSQGLGLGLGFRLGPGPRLGLGRPGAWGPGPQGLGALASRGLVPDPKLFRRSEKSPGGGREGVGVS